MPRILESTLPGLGTRMVIAEQPQMQGICTYTCSSSARAELSNKPGLMAYLPVVGKIQQEMCKGPLAGWVGFFDKVLCLVG